MNSPGRLEPVPRRSTAALIADQIRSAIMYGHLAPGDQLGETDLAAQLGVSRGPLREAMQRLVQEGLLRSERHRGLFVRELAAEDVRDIYVARLAVERASCELIMRGNRGEALARLTASLEDLVTAAETGDRTAMSDADQAFHQTLVSCSGNHRLERMAQTLLVETRMCLTVMQDVYPEAGELVDEHQKLLDAITEGNEALLLRLIESHMLDTVDRINCTGPVGASRAAGSSDSSGASEPVEPAVPAGAADTEGMDGPGSTDGTDGTAAAAGATGTATAPEQAGPSEPSGPSGPSGTSAVERSSAAQP